MLYIQRKLILWVLGIVLSVTALAITEHVQVSNVDVLTDNTQARTHTPATPHLQTSDTGLPPPVNAEPVQSTQTVNVETSQITDQSQPSLDLSSPDKSNAIEPSFSEVTTATSLKQSTLATESLPQSTATDQSDVPLQNTQNIQPDQTKETVTPETLASDTNPEPSDTPVVSPEDVPDTGTFPEQPQGQHDVNTTQAKETGDEAPESSTGSSPDSVSPEAYTDLVGGEAAAHVRDREVPADDEKGLPGVEGEMEKVTTEDKAKEEGLTFNEWILAEAEKKKEAETEEAKIPVLPPIKLRKKKNFASHDCGAKILGGNPEATNAKSILNSNKDDYMNSPCKVKKWFVMELCEPIQALSVEIASLELFSSQPKKFKVMLSDRYPTKDWRVAGDFVTKDERTLQTFLITEVQDYFAKYVRVEFSEHFGDEHFCPITFFRVLGVAVADYEDDDHPGHVDDDDDDDDPDIADTDQDGESKNLFESAKDTVLGLMKRVMNVDSENEGNGNATSNGTELSNGTVESEQSDKKGDSTLPCVPVANVEGSLDDKEVLCTPSPIQPQPPVPGESNIVRILEDDEQIETNISYPDEIETFPYILTADKSVHQTLQECGKKRDTFLRKNHKKSFYHTRMCRFMFILLRKSYGCPSFIVKPSTILSDQDSPAVHIHHPSATSDVHMPGSSQSTETSQNVPSEIVTQPISSSDLSQTTSLNDQKGSLSQDTAIDIKSSSEINFSKDTVEPTKSVELEQSVDADDNLQTGSPDIHVKQTVSQTSATKVQEQSKTLTILEKETDDTVIIDPSPTSVSIESKVSISEAQGTPSLPNDWKPDTKDVMEQNTEAGNQDSRADTTTLPIVQPQPTSVYIDTSAPTASKVTPPVPDVNPTQADLSRSSEDIAMDTGDLDDLSDDLVIETTTELPPDTTTVTTAKSNTTVIDDKVVIDGSDVRTEKDGKLGLVRVPVVPTGKRESAIMRLSNRIKVLEQNVSLSSRFLEELSRRYKKQSEDMMKMLDKTMAKVSDMTVEADVKNKLHEDEMSAMEQRLENLTAIVQRLTVSFDTLNKQVTDRQMIWMSVLIVFCMVLFIIFRRKPINFPPEIQTLLDTMPTKPSAQGPDPSKRRNSISGPATPSKKMADTLQGGGGLQRFSSETYLAKTDGSYSSRNPIDNKQANDGNKKKKKKKNKGSETRLFSNAGGPYQGESDIFPDTSQTARETSQLPATAQSSSFMSMFLGWPKGRSNSLGANDSDKRNLEEPKDTNGATGSIGAKGTKSTGKGLSKKPPVSLGHKISPKMAPKVNKSLGDVTRANSSNFTEEGKLVKGHKRQRSLPKQHYSAIIETVGHTNAPVYDNSWTTKNVPGVPSKTSKKSEIKKSASLPESGKSHSRNGSKDSLSSCSGSSQVFNGFHEDPTNEKNSLMPDHITGQCNPLAKSKSDPYCSTRLSKCDELGTDPSMYSQFTELPQIETFCSGRGSQESVSNGEVFINGNGFCRDMDDCRTASLLHYGPERTDSALFVNQDQTRGETTSYLKKMWDIFR